MTVLSVLIQQCQGSGAGGEDGGLGWGDGKRIGIEAQVSIITMVLQSNQSWAFILFLIFYVLL